MIGNRKKAVSVFSRLTNEGFIVVSVSYRLCRPRISWPVIGTMSCAGLVFSPTAATLAALVALMALIMIYTASQTMGVGHDEQILDVTRALEWVQSNIQRFGGNPNLIYVMGHSAGAHLASLAAHRVSVAGAICISGVYSDRRLSEIPVGSMLLSTVFGSSRTRAFPIYQVSATRSPPHLLINAEDDVGLKRHALDYHLTLRAAGVWVSSHVTPGTNHLTIVRGWDSWNKRTADLVVAFVRDTHPR